MQATPVAASVLSVRFRSFGVTDVAAFMVRTSTRTWAVIPAMFVAFYPQLDALNVMRLATPESAMLSAIIFNAVIIIALIPLALRGVSYRALGAAAVLRRNLLIFGLGGLVAPFVGIKIIDIIVSALHLV